MKHACLIVFLIVIIAGLASCAKPDAPPPASPSASPTESAPPVPTPEVSPTSDAYTPECTEVTIADASGKALWTLKARKNGYTLYDGSGKTAGEIETDVIERAIEIKDPEGKTVLTAKHVKRGRGEMKYGEKLYYIKGGKNRTRTILDSEEKELYKVAMGGKDKMIITGDAGSSAIVEDKKVTITNEKGTTLYIVEGFGRQGCFMGMETLDPIQRIALMTYFTECHGKRKERARKRRKDASSAPSETP